MGTSVRKHFDSQLRDLNERILKMASETEHSIRVTIDALTNKNTSGLDDIVQGDALIDKLERQIEGKCLKLLLQQQPVAKDLRTISSALKIITDLERIADHSVDIGELILRMSFNEIFNDSKINEILYNIQLMANSSVRMVGESIIAYTEHNLNKANMIIEADDCIDDYFIQIRDKIVQYIVDNNGDKHSSELVVDLLNITKYLEKIGDHAVNIAEWIKFDITGIHKDERII